MSYDGLFYETLVDPNGREHQIGDSQCSGCVWESPNRQCSEEIKGVKCGGLNHYWTEDEDETDSYIAYECDKCGNNESLKPSMNEEWA